MSPLRDRADGVRQIVKGRVLQDEARHTRIDELHDVFVPREDVHHDDMRPRNGSLHLLRQTHAALAARSDIQEDHLRIRLSQHCSIGAGRADDDLDVGELIQEGGYPFARQSIVFDQGDRNERAIGLRGGNNWAKRSRHGDVQGKDAGLPRIRSRILAAVVGLNTRTRR